MNLQLILASSSPQRRKILKQAKIRFTVMPSHVREKDPARVPAKEARALVMDLAEKKARQIARRFKGQSVLVLGADTLVVCGKKILGKPKNFVHACKMLKMLSGHWQTVLTGLCVIDAQTQKARLRCAATKLMLKSMDEATIRRIAAKNLDKSGSYAVQNLQDRYLEKIQGDLDNVIGLPMRLVGQMLKLTR